MGAAARARSIFRAVIGLVVNPRARLVARDPAIINRLRAALGHRGRVRATRNVEELRAALAEFRTDGCETIATCGGDGTNVFVLTEMVRLWQGDLPAMALLRGGTINIVAQNLGIRGKPEAILRRLLRGRAEGRPARSAELDTLVVGGRTGFIFATGIPPRFLSSYYDGRGTGTWRAMALVARALGSILVGGAFSRSLLEPVPTEFSTDASAPTLGSPNLIVATTVPNVGLGLRVGYLLGRSPGHFHALVASARGHHLWTSLLPALRGQPASVPSQVDGLVRRLDLGFEVDQDCLLDGEIFSARRVTVEIGARVRFEIG